MVKKISKHTRNELIESIRQRYIKASKKEKTRILDEFIAVAGCHRKHAVRLLGHQYKSMESDKIIYGRRIYDEAVKDALIIIWESADRICSKRIKVILPDLVDAMERHGHLKLDPDVRQRLILASASTIDRLLLEVRKNAPSRKKRRKSSKKASGKIQVRTFADWNNPKPGYLEIDFVAHSGGLMSGTFIYTLVAVDICTGWVECIPLLAREQSLVVEGLKVLCGQFPFPILGIDSDNDSAFINDTVIAYCESCDIKFTRSRPWHKNDQAWIEQKNGAVVRRFVGYDRFSGVVSGQALARLYQTTRLYVNYFQPSFKLREKKRQGANVKRLYHKPATPHNRLISHPAIKDLIKKTLQEQRMQLDPVALLHQIRESQAALAALAAPEDNTNGPGRISLEKFLKQLPNLWQSGEVRPTHRKDVKPRNWRTRKDPFEGVWSNVLRWLQCEPEITAYDLFKRLRRNYPGKFTDGQLRTLQRRIKEWRHIMAKKLVHSCLDLNNDYAKISPVGADS